MKIATLQGNKVEKREPDRVRVRAYYLKHQLEWAGSGMQAALDHLTAGRADMARLTLEDSLRLVRTGLATTETSNA